ncbi:MAG: molybdopterin-binding/glycosyltransferase family 2 protein [Pseudomonadota bacterium]
MKFGPVALADAEGAVLAHSLRHSGGVIKKGRMLSAADLTLLSAAGITEVTVARRDPGDVAEDDAARRIAALIAAECDATTLSAPFTGRVNLYADQPGLVEIDEARVNTLNRIDEAITLATLGQYARAHPRQMLATVKIIPYAAPEAAVVEAETLLAAGPVVRLRPFATAGASLILTRVPGMADRVIEKGTKAVRDRLQALGIALVDEKIVPHETARIAAAMQGAGGQMILLLTGSATSDRADMGPAALVASGGKLLRFGMPVDPGNLLFVGELQGRNVIGLPGCARSPKLNGADWVLERLAAGIDVGDAQIAAMGVGGLLKEIPSRPTPRAGGEAAPRRPVIATILLAAGSSRRMQGRDKLLEPVSGEALLRRLAQQSLASGADQTMVVLRDEDPLREDALRGLDVTLCRNRQAAEGMGTSIAAAIRALGVGIDGALILMADMPEVTAADLDRLIAAFDPAEGRAIVRATTAVGEAGHPVLFGRRFFEPLAALEGDTGAREVLREHAEFVVDVALPGERAVIDLDTQDAWDAWRRKA